MAKDTEQFKKGHSNRRILGSATRKHGIKRRLESKTIEQKYNTIMEIEKGHRSKSEIAKLFNVPKSTLSGR